MTIKLTKDYLRQLIKEEMATLSESSFKIDNIEVTTNHPQSSHGTPVVVFNKTAYGPEDIIHNNIMMGSALITSDTLTGNGVLTISSSQLKLLCKWFLQSKKHGKRWCTELFRLVNNAKYYKAHPDELE